MKEVRTRESFTQELEFHLFVSGRDGKSVGSGDIRGEGVRCTQFTLEYKGIA